MSYQELVDFCGGNERQAWYLSHRLAYRHLEEEDMVQAVVCLLISGYVSPEWANSEAAVEYCGGQRRDVVRKALAGV